MKLADILLDVDEALDIRRSNIFVKFYEDLTIYTNTGWKLVDFSYSMVHNDSID